MKYVNLILIIVLYIVVGVLFSGNQVTVSGVNIDLLPSESVLEILYYFSGIFTVIAIIIAIKSFYISKSDIEERRTREINNLTIEKCNEYLSSFTLIVDKHEKKSDFFIERKSETSFSGEIDESEILEIYNKYQDDFTEELTSSTIDLLNKIEGFSFYFTKGTLNKEIACKLIKQVYRDGVETLYLYILYLRCEYKDLNLYEDIEELYHTLDK